MAAGLTGRTPRYGYHLAEKRRATLLLHLAITPRELHDWGALGGVVGRIAGDYWQVPAMIGIDRVPTSDELKHFGAAMASYGSVALFHMVGVTPEAERLSDIADPSLRANVTITEADLHAFKNSYSRQVDKVDVVVFSSPQLSLLEMRDVAGMLDGRHATIPLLVVTSPQVKPDADRLGVTARIEAAGGLVLSGMCFYQSYAREMAEANGWQALATNSAKLVNILGGYGYRPALLSMQACVDAACAGRISKAANLRSAAGDMVRLMPAVTPMPSLNTILPNTSAALNDSAAVMPGSIAPPPGWAGASAVVPLSRKMASRRAMILTASTACSAVRSA